MGFTTYTGKHSTTQASIAEGVDLHRVNATQNLDDKDHGAMRSGLRHRRDRGMGQKKQWWGKPFAYDKGA